MNISRYAPAFRYQLRDFLLGAAPFFAVIVVVAAASLVGAVYFGGDVTFSGYGMAAAICIFVFGVVSPRPNLRLCIQMGVSRRTAFLAQLLAVAVCIAVLAIGGEILFAVCQALGGSDPDFFLKDLYQLFYLDENTVILTLGQHAASALFNGTMLLATFTLGMFFTFLFWRLNRVWTVVAAVSIPLLLNGIPALCWRLSRVSPAVSRALTALVDALARSAWNLMLAFVLMAAVFTAVSWLLVRRANIRAPQGK